MSDAPRGLSRRPVPNTATAAEMEKAPATPGSRITYRRADTITPTRPIWVWLCWTLAGAVNLIVGRQGSGKTTFVAWLISRLTKGQALPGDVARDPISVAYLSLEESPDTVVARLTAAGADLSRVQVLGLLEEVDAEGHTYMRQWTLPKDIGALGKLIDKESIDVAVIDGLGYSISGDSHNYAVVGSALSALAAEAARTGAAIIGVVHPPKGATDPVTAAIGSTAWTSVPRVVMVLGCDPDDESGARRVVRISKTNYRNPATGYSFTIKGDAALEVGYVADVKPSDVSAETLMAIAPTEDERSEQSEVADLLRSMCADGPRTVEDIRNQLTRSGFDLGEKTLQRARKRAGLVTGTPGRFGGKRSYMRPEHRDPSDVDGRGVQTDDADKAAGRDSVSPDTPSVDTPSSFPTVQTVSRLSPHSLTREKVPLPDSVDTLRGNDRTVSGLDTEP